MKKILFILIAVIGFNIANAQTGNLLSQYNNTVDTVTNGAAKTLTSGKVAGSGVAKTVEIQVNVTEISGTTGGTLTLQASVDGLTWYSYYGSRDSTYTFTPLDVATQGFRFHLSNTADQYYRVTYTGTGTMSAKVSAKYVAVKASN